MAGEQRRGGIVSLQVNGEVIDVQGDVDYNLGGTVKEPLVGTSGIQGFTEKYQVPFVSVDITDRKGLDLAAMKAVENATVTCQHPNGKTIVLYEGWGAGDWDANTEKGAIKARWEGLRAAEV